LTEKATYALLIYRSGLGEAAPESARRVLPGHRAVQAEASARGELHAVARLDAAAKAKTVAKRGGAHDVIDGPYIETKEWLVGFYLLDCDTEEEALERARTICADEDHVVVVQPVTWRWKP
jgi:hypothetical protein